MVVPASLRYANYKHQKREHTPAGTTLSHWLLFFYIGGGWEMILFTSTVPIIKYKSTFLHVNEKNIKNKVIFCE
jgi:hypothetical protein